MGLILLIDHSSSRLEAIPYIFPVLLAHRAVLLPLLVILLEILEGLHNVFAQRKRLSLLAKGYLRLQILTEIEVAKIAVDLYHIVELLHLELVRIIYISIGLRRHRTGFLPAVLKLAEGREARADIVLAFCQSLKLLDYGLLGGKICLTHLVLDTVVLCPVLFVIGIHRLEILLCALKGFLGLGFKRSPLSLDSHLGYQAVES